MILNVFKTTYGAFLPFYYQKQVIFFANCAEKIWFVKHRRFDFKIHNYQNFKKKTEICKNTKKDNQAFRLVKIC